MAPEKNGNVLGMFTSLPSQSLFPWLPPQGCGQPENQGYASFNPVSAGPNVVPVTGLRNTRTISDEGRGVRDKTQRKFGQQRVRCCQAG